MVAQRRTVRGRNKSEDTEALIQRNPRKRTDSEESDHVERWQPPAGTWNDNLPYGGKVYLARMKKPDASWVKVLEVRAIYSMLHTVIKFYP